jgi:hypothetical protein
MIELHSTHKRAPNGTACDTGVSMTGSSTTDIPRKKSSRTRLRGSESKVSPSQPLTHSMCLTIAAWAKEGIVGRGVLIDYVSYAKRNGIDYNPLDYYAVPLKIAKQIAEECKFEFQAGDIIFLRTGKQCTRADLIP